LVVVVVLSTSNARIGKVHPWKIVDDPSCMEKEKLWFCEEGEGSESWPYIRVLGENKV
jgi:hypothetical protein